MQNVQNKNKIENSEVKAKNNLIKKIDFVFCVVAFSLWIKSLVFLFEVNRVEKINKIMTGILSSYKIMLIILAIMIFMCAMLIYFKKKSRIENLKYVSIVMLLIAMISSMLFRKTYTILYMPFGMFLLSIGLMFKGRHRVISYIVIDVFASLIIWMDSILFRAYGSFLSIEYIFHPNAFNSSNRNLISYTKFQDILYFIDIVILIYIFIRYKRLYLNREKNLIKNLVISLSVMMFSIVWIFSIYYFFDVKNITHGSTTFLTPRAWNLTEVVSRTSSLGYHFFEVSKKLTIGKKYKLTAEDRKEINEWYEENDENLPNNKYNGLMKDKNVIFLQVESMENFVINEEVQGQEITPNLNRLLKNSYYFKNIYEQVYYNSGDGDFMSNTGIIPLTKESSYRRYPFSEYNSLAKILERKNYSTWSFHPEDSDGWNWRDNHFKFGYDNICDNRDFVVDEIVSGDKISDESLYRQTVEKLKNKKQPFLLHMATMTSHGPFSIISEKKELNLNEKLNESMIGTYFQVMKYVDSSIGKFIELLEKNKMLDNTILVIYGDHAGPHKYYQDEIDNMNEVDGMKELWKEKDIRIPFIIYNPSISGEVIDTIGGQIDILPTSLSLLGVEKENYIKSVMGRNLLNTRRNSTVLTNDTIVGTPNSEEERKHLLNMTKISDKIIEGDYFKGKY